ncbi:unnamed protein product [Linum trigynum]|uniref:Cell division control protein 73 C-terminal domain-containing protein n=1 Tax=Linum trigynum TaxID=586398 RepID=A0AAV2FG32_9ROSI
MRWLQFRDEAETKREKLGKECVPDFDNDLQCERVSGGWGVHTSGCEGEANERGEASLTVQKKFSTDRSKVMTAYEVRDKPSALKSDDWDRVVAVFVLRKEWQFKDWPYKDQVQILANLVVLIIGKVVIGLFTRL